METMVFTPNLGYREKYMADYALYNPALATAYTSEIVQNFLRTPFSLLSTNRKDLSTNQGMIREDYLVTPSSLAYTRKEQIYGIDTSEWIREGLFEIPMQKASLNPPCDIVVGDLRALYPGLIREIRTQASVIAVSPNGRIVLVAHDSRTRVLMTPMEPLPITQGRQIRVDRVITSAEETADMRSENLQGWLRRCGVLVRPQDTDWTPFVVQKVALKVLALRGRPGGGLDLHPE